MAQDGVTVQRVLGIKSGPASDELEGIESQDDFGQIRPKELLKTPPIPIEIKSHLVVFQGSANEYQNRL